MTHKAPHTPNPQSTAPTLLGIFWTLLKRDCRLAWSQGGTGTMGVSFFLIACSLFPFGLGVDPSVLSQSAIAVIWVMALLAGLLSLDRLYQADFEDGSLDQLMVSPLGGLGITLAKSLAHWISSIVPLILIAPLLAVMFYLPPSAYGALMISLLIGTPAISLIGSIGAALTIAVKRGGVLLSLIVLPLYVPTLIFGVAVIKNAAAHMTYVNELTLLGAITLVALVVAPVASSAALKLAQE